MHFMDLCDFFFGHGIKWQHRTDTGVIGWGMPWRSLLPRLKICRFQVHINKTFRCARHWFDINCQVLFDQERLDEFKTNRWQVQVGSSWYPIGTAHGSTWAGAASNWGMLALMIRWVAVLRSSGDSDGHGVMKPQVNHDMAIKAMQGCLQNSHNRTSSNWTTYITL